MFTYARKIKVCYKVCYERPGEAAFPRLFVYSGMLPLMRSKCRRSQFLYRVHRSYSWLCFLHVFNKVAGLAFKEFAQALHIHPGHQLAAPECLQRAFAKKTLFADAVCIIAFFLQSGEYIEFVSDRHLLTSYPSGGFFIGLFLHCTQYTIGLH